MITGASGCVGQHIAARLLRDSDANLSLWLRDPSRLTAIPRDHPRIRLLVGDLREPEAYLEALAGARRVIHAATAWGDPQRAQAVNVVAVKRLLDHLDPEKLEQILYFSTASILDRHLRVIPQAMQNGTEYIQTKAQCLQQLESHPLAPRIVALFPTLVFGGRVDGSGPFPRSYLTAGLSDACRWLWLARWFRADASFHFIHAEDIAQVCAHLVLQPHESNREPGQGPLRRLVLGQPAVTVDDTVAELCRWRATWRPPGLPLRGWLIDGLTRVLPVEMTAWDRFSIAFRHFVHEPVSPPERFGLSSHAATLPAIFQDARLAHR